MYNTSGFYGATYFISLFNEITTFFNSKKH